jgi:hypothetical protein
MPASVRRSLVRISFSSWGTVLLAAVVVGALVVSGVAVTSPVFWIVLGVAVLPLLVLEAILPIVYARRGESRREVRRELSAKTLADLERRGKL